MSTHASHPRVPTPVGPSRLLLRRLGGALAIASLAALALASGAALAEEATPIVVTFESLQLGDYTARGLSPALDLWVTAPSAGLAGDATLRLAFAPSPMLSAPSAVTVSVNDVAVWSMPIGDVAGPSRRAATASLPREAFKPGLNRVGLRFSLRTAGDDCQDPDLPGRFVTLFRDSSLSFVPGERAGAVAPTLADFPRPFLAVPGETQAPIVVVVPAQATRASFTAAARLAARLGQGGGGGLPGLQLRSADQVTPELLGASHVVLVGARDELPLVEQAAEQLALRWRPGTPGTWLSADGEAARPDDGVIAVGRSPWNERRALLALTGASPEGVAKAGAALAAWTVRGAAARQVAVVPAAPRVYEADVLGQGDTLQLSLRGLGQSNLTYSGQGTSLYTLAFTAGVPDPEKPATLELVTSPSPGLDRGRSSATVEVNGVAVTSTPLEAGPAGVSTARVAIPAGVLRPGLNTLRVGFNLYLPPTPGCGALAEERAFVTLLASTTLSVPQRGGAGGPDLAAYPYPFVANQVVAPTALLLPADPAERAGSLAVAAALGRWASGDALGLEAGLPEQFADAELAVRDLIVYGTSAGNPLALVASQRAGLNPVERTRPLEPLGVVGEERSAWNPERLVLYVSATQPDLLVPAANALTPGKLAGTVTLVDREGRLSAPAAAVSPAAPEVLRAGLDPLRGAAAAVVLATLVVLGVGAYQRTR